MNDESSNMGGHSEEALFHAALSLPAGERAAYLDKACRGDFTLRRRLELMLQASESGKGFLPAEPGGGRVAAIIIEKPGDRLGPYRLLEKLGEGGFGVVFKAEQVEPIRRIVAIKIVKLGMDTRDVIARFEAERQSLAMMDHPNIAKVLEAGATTSGRPYFVMELVNGVPITEYCDQHRLSTRERLGLFTAIGKAVQHAHTRGIIHRDIKPSNVLVTEQDGQAVPKLIDFGIAKATAGSSALSTVATVLGVLGTPAYMSPEQADFQNPDLDTRSDVYSLGVLLYELLTGRPPFDPLEMARLSMEAVFRTIREQDPPRPSDRLTTLAAGKLTETARQRQVDPGRLSRLLRGDLDCIVMKCLEKQRDRRYESASALIRDIECHLNNQPIAAAPPGPFRRLQKLAVRNKLACALGAAAMVILGLGLVYWWFLPGVLSFDFAPADAGIEVDGRRVSAVTRPIQMTLPAGVHQLRLFKDEYEAALRTVIIPRGGVASLQKVSLQHDQGTLEVDNDSSGTLIRLGNANSDYNRIRNLRVDTGTYDLMGFGENFFEEHRALTIRKDQTNYARFSLENGVSATYVSTSFQSGFVVLTNQDSADDPVIAHNALDGVVFLSATGQTISDTNKISLGGKYTMQRINFGGRLGSLLMVAQEQSESNAEPLVAAYSDGWPTHLLWTWAVPTNSFTRSGGHTLLALTNNPALPRMALAGSDGVIYILDATTGRQLKAIRVIESSVKFMYPELAWGKPGQAFLFAAICHFPTNELADPDSGMLEGVALNPDTGDIRWRKSLGTNGCHYSYDLTLFGTPGVFCADDTHWQLFNAESGRIISGGSLPDTGLGFTGLACAGARMQPSLVFGFADPNRPLRAVNPLDGSTLWEGPTNVLSPQKVDPESFVPHTPDGKLLVMLNDSLVALNPTNGRVIWRLQETPRSLLVDHQEGDIYVTLGDRRLFCLAPGGSTNWILGLREDLVLRDFIRRPGEKSKPDLLLSIHAAIIQVVHWPKPLLWQSTTQSPLESPPLIASRTVIQLCEGAGNAVNLQGFDAATGRTIWTQAGYTFVPNRTPLLADLDGDGIPEIILFGSKLNDRLLIDRLSRRLVVLNAADGRVIRDPLRPGSSWIGCTPAVADFRGSGYKDVAYNVWEDRKIMMIDGRSGESRWEHETGAGNMGGVVATDLDGDGLADVISTSGDGHVYALRGKDGKLIWQSPGTNYPSYSGPVLVDLDGNGTRQVLVVTLAGRLVVLESSTGHLLWSPDIAGNMPTAGRATVTHYQGHPLIIAPMSANGVVAFDWINRRELWRSPPNDPVVATPVTADLAHDGNPVVVAATRTGRVMLLRLADGKLLWREKIAEGEFVADPVVSDLDGDGIDDLLLASKDMRLYALSGKKILATLRTR